MKIMKRNGTRVDFDIEKIINAITKANDEMSNKNDKITNVKIKKIAKEIETEISEIKRPIGVEEIQDKVEEKLMATKKFNLARCYITYRYQHMVNREGNPLDKKIISIANCNNQEAKEENANKNPTIAPVQRDYYAGELSRDITRRLLLPKEISEAHDEGIIHFHDTDYFLTRIHNCCLINLEDMLQNGTVISKTMIEKPHHFTTACNIATQIIAQVASNQYGGSTISLAHLAPFVDMTRQRIIKKNKENEETILNSVGHVHKKLLSYIIKTKFYQQAFYKNVEREVLKDIEKGIQMLQYQVVTLMTTNGQTPFISFNMYLNEAKNEREKEDLKLIIEEVLKQRIQGIKNEAGQWISPAFPKLLYVLQEDNVRKGSKYYELTRLAAKCTAKRMVPDYISEKIMKHYKEDNCYPCMGCRSFLNVWKDEHNEYKFYGRFNKGVVTINLADVALSSNGDKEEFWKIFDERLELCHKALLVRYERLKGTTSDIAPIMWQHGALARLKPGEVIDKYLEGGYSSISLGYAGLYECTLYMTGETHTHTEGEVFAMKVMQYMNDKCAQWNSELNLGFSVYGTPIESTTYKFAKALQKRFGIIKGITDKNYITNSYHVNPEEEIDAFSKLEKESKFQQLSPGGAISYVEIPNMKNNIDAVMSIIEFIYDHIMYAELNTRYDFCHECNFEGEITLAQNKDKVYYWKCPKCGNTNLDKMNIVRRTCGYIGSNEMNNGRLDEIKKRVLHI